MSKRYDFIHDPGHGWLKIPLADLSLNAPENDADVFFPSSYSFYDKEFAYLEEDCDATEFWRRNPDITFNDVFVEHFDRNRKRF